MKPPLGAFITRAATVAIFLTAVDLAYGARLCSNLFSSHPIAFLPGHFAPSPFGTIHADRPANRQYPQWSADTAHKIFDAILNGKTEAELFGIGIKARQEFARKFEGIEKPEEDFGSPRQTRSRFAVGEDMMGLSTIDLGGKKAEPVPSGFSNWPHQWWPNIAFNRDRSHLADALVVHLKKDNQLGAFDYNLLIVDRHYETSTGEILKSSSTKFQRLNPDDQKSPYLVSTLNAPKPEIDPLMADVYRRIRMALTSKDKDEARNQLGHAMYGFFNAMPYYRGSAAIGRIVFTALFSYIEGKAVVLDPECDVKALTQHQLEYLNNLPTLAWPVSEK